jgi:hypothetical protein
MFIFVCIHSCFQDFFKLNLVRRIVASIACNFGIPGSDLLDYTTLNVKPMDHLMFIKSHDRARS